MESLSLILFSTTLQAAIGIMVFVALGYLLNKSANFKLAYITAAVLGLVGLLATLLHLGSPLRALNALYQFGDSWLSKEIWFTGLFVGGVVVGLICLLLKAKLLAKLAAFVTALIGLVDIFAMASIYDFASVPAWTAVGTFPEFYAAALAMGGILFIVLSGADAAPLKRSIAIVVTVLVAAQVAFGIVSFVQLGANSSAASAASFAFLNDQIIWLIIKWLFVVVGAALLWLPAKEGKANIAPVYGALALLLIGQVVGRVLFYEMMVVSGIGVPM